MDNSEGHIIELINCKKSEGYKYLYENYYASLCGFSAHFLKYKEDTEDIVQDVILRLWKSESKFDSFKALTSYLYLSVKNACLNAIRNNNKKSDIDISSGKDIECLVIEDKTIQQVIIEEEFYRQIYVAINKLSPERKKIVLLSLEGMTNKEIASETGVSVNTVKTLKQKAYRLLRKELKAFAILFSLHFMNVLP